MLFTEMPTDIIPLIIRYLPPEEIYSLATMNKNIFHIIHSSSASFIWEDKMQLHFPKVFQKWKPYFSLTKVMSLDWFTLFKNTYQKNTIRMSQDTARLFSLIRENKTTKEEFASFFGKPHFFDSLSSHKDDYLRVAKDFANVNFLDAFYEVITADPTWDNNKKLSFAFLCRQPISTLDSLLNNHPLEEALPVDNIHISTIELAAREGVGFFEYVLKKGLTNHKHPLIEIIYFAVTQDCTSTISYIINQNPELPNKKELLDTRVWQSPLSDAIISNNALSTLTFFLNDSSIEEEEILKMLKCAITNEKWDIAKFLLGRTTNLSKKDELYINLLPLAAQNGELSFLADAFTDNVEIQKKIFIRALQADYPFILTWILEKNPNLLESLENNDIKQIFYIIAEQPTTHTLQFLLNKKMDWLSYTSDPEDPTSSLLGEACYRDNIKVVAFLTQQIKKPPMPGKLFFEVIRDDRRGILELLCTANGATPFPENIWTYEKAAKYLLSKEAALFKKHFMPSNVTAQGSLNPLEIAIITSAERILPYVLSLMPNEKSDKENSERAMQLAILSGQKSFKFNSVEFLYGAGFPMSENSLSLWREKALASNSTPFFSSGEKRVIAKLLLEKKITPDDAIHLIQPEDTWNSYLLWSSCKNTVKNILAFSSLYNEETAKRKELAEFFPEKEFPEMKTFFSTGK